MKLIDDDSYGYAPSHEGLGYDRSLEEPPDDDRVYFATWEEVEARAAEMKRNAERFKTKYKQVR